METNIRLVEPGDKLYIMTRKVSLSVNDLTSEQLQAICSILKKEKLLQYL